MATSAQTAAMKAMPARLVGLERRNPVKLSETPRRQQETGRYWNAIVGNGGQENACGWCKDKWGISWQITPRVLMEAMAAGGDEAKRAFEAMMDMKNRRCRDRSGPARPAVVGRREARGDEREKMVI
jgi:hypothetical protein